MPLPAIVVAGVKAVGAVASTEKGRNFFGKVGKGLFKADPLRVIGNGIKKLFGGGGLSLASKLQKAKNKAKAMSELEKFRAVQNLKKQGVPADEALRMVNAGITSVTEGVTKTTGGTASNVAASSTSTVPSPISLMTVGSNPWPTLGVNPNERPELIRNVLTPPISEAFQEPSNNLLLWVIGIVILLGGGFLIMRR